MDASREVNPRDPGLQPERTTIAWTRTCTALIVVGLIGTRFHTGALAIVVTLSGLIAASVLLLFSARRGRRTETGMRSEQVMPAMSLAAALTLLVVLLDISSVAMVLYDR